MNMVIAARFTHRLRGLLGSREEEWRDRALLLAPCSSIHTFGMSYALDVVFASRDGRVLAAYREVTPGHQLSCPHSSVVLERACSPREAWFEIGQTIFEEPQELGIYSFNYSNEQEKEVNHGQHWSKTQDDSGVAEPKCARLSRTLWVRRNCH